MRWATNDTEGSSRVARNCFLCVRTWYFAEFYLRATFSCARRQIVSYDNSRRMERSEHNSDSNCDSRWNKKMKKEISRKKKFQLHINIDFAKWKTWRPKRISKLFSLHFAFHFRNFPRATFACITLFAGTSWEEKINALHCVRAQSLPLHKRRTGFFIPLLSKFWHSLRASFS